MHASRRDIEYDRRYARNHGGGMKQNVIIWLIIILRIIVVIAVIVAFSSLITYARSQYTNGLLAGYSAGEAQGKLEAMVTLQQWQYQHRCRTTLDGFVSIKMWRDRENRYQFDCLVSK